MGHDSSQREGKLCVVHLKADVLRLALVVDEIVAEQQLVSKRLPYNLRRVPGISGAVVLADGSLAAALDVVYLLQQERRPAPQSPTPASPTPHPSHRLLVVDDALTARTAAQMVLTSAGYEVQVAVDGDAAWRLLQEHHFDLVVSDVEMPGLDGFALTRRIRADERLRHLPVILVTRRHTAEDIAAGAAAGADEYVVKGALEQEKLLTALKRLLPATAAGVRP
jgi:two-component system chemotaxis sensor kinase CheA